MDRLDFFLRGGTTGGRIVENVGGATRATHVVALELNAVIVVCFDGVGRETQTL